MFSSQNSQVSSAANYIEEVFSTYLYTGDGSTQTITNGIDLSTKGGLVWIKRRVDTPNASNVLTDTARGVQKELYSNSASAQATNIYGLNSFNADGFGIGNASSYDYAYNEPNKTYVSWTFRKQPKFFDVVTYTGDGIAGRTVAHNLGSVPGCMIVKCTSTTGQWVVYHRVLGNTSRLYLNSTGGSGVDSGNWNNTDPTSTEFTLGNSSGVNASTRTYVAYLFAHDAGGFGLTGTDNVISCGSYTSTGVSQNIEVGFEPQFLMLKKTSGSGGNWFMLDIMRGQPNGGPTAVLSANSSGAEISTTYPWPTATGFTDPGDFNNGDNIIYIAIRRGPMRAPTSGASVFSPVAYTGNATDTTRSAGFPVDMLAILRRSNPFGDGDGNPRFMDRLRGGNSTSLISSSSSAEETSTNNTLYLDNSVGFKTTANNAGAPTGYYFNVSTNPYIAECFRRAPSFFDVVCYTGTGSARTVAHNLGVAPELMIVKSRSNAFNWSVYNASIGATNYLYLNLTTASSAFSGFWNDTSPTASVFSVGGIDAVNGSGFTYVAYLFATCPGVQYINSYVGDGTTGRTINCGFTGGARFVCIKATSTSGSWWLFDSARGIVTNSDPALQLNSTAAEITSADAIDTAASGFIVNQEATCSLNASGVTYLVWAIA